jgi:tRNA threonylcarbamoyladenosine biosynthesis protein TsaB
VLGVEPIAAVTARRDDLIPAIDRLCRRLGAQPRDIARIAVSIGPGAYTPLRIAVATAAMLARALRAECVPVRTPAVAASLADGAPHPFAVCLASKRDTTHATLFRAPGNAADEGRLIRADDVPDLGVRALVADAHLPPAIRATAERAGILIAPLALEPAACLELGHAGEPVAPERLRPAYAREPEAVRLWGLRAGWERRQEG